MTDKAIVKKDAPDLNWSQVVDEITEQLTDGDLPESVIQATELLLCGYPIRDIANKVGVQPAVVRRWISQYPQVAAVLADQRSNLIKLRLNLLERQFYKAIHLSDEILNVDITNKDANPKLLGVLAQHSRFIIGLYAGQRVDVHVTHEIGKETLRAKQDALDYIARRLSEFREENEPVEGTYRVIDDNHAASPLLGPDGEPFHGKLGVLDKDDDYGYLCHICGKNYQRLEQHIANRHGLSNQEYELTFMLEKDALKNAR